MYEFDALIWRTGHVDYSGEVLEPGALKGMLAGYDPPQPLSLNFNYQNRPVGHCVKVWVKDGDIYGRFQITDEALTQALLDGRFEIRPSYIVRSEREDEHGHRVIEHADLVHVTLTSTPAPIPEEPHDGS